MPFPAKYIASDDSERKTNRERFFAGNSTEALVSNGCFWAVFVNVVFFVSDCIVTYAARVR